MNQSTKYYAFIPARYASTRFPGKPLALLNGKPMFWHVWDRARQCPLLESVTLATDDDRILNAATDLNVPCVLTKSNHQSGTDRVYEAACILNIAPNSVVVNIQGDEPTLNPEMLTDLLNPFSEAQVHVTTLARKITASEALSSDQVKVVLAKSGDALYFSRCNIPFDRENTGHDILGHIGLYAFRMSTLKQFTALEQSTLEAVEKLEQLRLLENGIAIRVALTKHKSFGVDKPEDLLHAIEFINSRT